MASVTMKGWRRKRATSAPEAAPAATPDARCAGSVRIASTVSFTVSGGPQTVQSPGLYTWPCGNWPMSRVLDWVGGAVDPHQALRS